MPVSRTTRRAFLSRSSLLAAAAAQLVSTPFTAWAGGQCRPTSKDILGPYYQPDAPTRTAVAAAGEPGERLLVEGTVSSCSGPRPGALVEVWQATAEGCYSINQECGTIPATPDKFRLRAQFRVDSGGRYAFTTIRPGHYRAGPSVRPSHIHYRVTLPGSGGEKLELITQLYFEGDPYNGQDQFSSSPEAKSRIIPLAKKAEGGFQGRFDIVLPAAESSADLGGHDLLIRRTNRKIVCQWPRGGGRSLELFKPSGPRLQVWETASDHLELDLSQIGSGLYLAQLSSSEDSETFHFRV